MPTLRSGATTCTKKDLEQATEHRQVIKLIALAEKIGDEEIRAWIRGFADGRVFSGRQALAYGLVDDVLEKRI